MVIGLWRKTKFNNEIRPTRKVSKNNKIKSTEMEKFNILLRFTN